MLAWEGLVNMKINKIAEPFQSTAHLSSHLSINLGIPDIASNFIKITYGRFHN